MQTMLYLLDLMRAQYDSSGNIILPPDEEPIEQQARVFHASMWEVVEESPRVDQSRLSRHMSKNQKKQKRAGLLTRSRSQRKLQGIRQSTQQSVSSFIDEGKSQYSWGLTHVTKGSKGVGASLRALGRNMWAILSQPVWVINPKKQTTKEYSRGTLFLVDTVRFGGTFAVIFGVLFVSLNYQSFWQIVTSQINPLQSAQSGGNAETAILRDKLLKSPSLATAGSQGDLLALLPAVGPPENRIIIPRLSLNVPLVTPSYASLLNEDWDRLEEDIQIALEDGVVHYPGTARPGQAGNFFVTGHSSYYPWAEGAYKTIFARLHELQIGDEYWIYYGGDKYRYKIMSKKEVKPTNVSVLDQPTHRRTGTLMTCTPVGTTLRRLIVSSEEIHPETGAPMEVGERQKRKEQKIKVEALPI